jgi:hypothetical protein
MEKPIAALITKLEFKRFLQGGKMAILSFLAKSMKNALKTIDKL